MESDMAIRYVFKEDSVIALPNMKNADPQILGECLADIQKRNDGRLKPQNVVDVARDKSSPLHMHFEWDDKKCGIAHRISQARDLIGCFVMIDDDKKKSTHNQGVAAFISVTDNKGPSYRSAQEVMGSVELQKNVLAAAKRELEAFQKRFQSLKGLCADIETVKRRHFETESV
jgi:hypothetical protein